MPLAEQQLAQARPANTTEVSIYSPGTGVTTIIKQLHICNTTASPATARVFIDDDGTTYTEATAIVWDLNVPANDYVSLSVYWPMADDAGNFAVRSGTGNALTFTVFGVEIT